MVFDYGNLPWAFMCALLYGAGAAPGCFMVDPDKCMAQADTGRKPQGHADTRGGGPDETLAATSDSVPAITCSAQPFSAEICRYVVGADAIARQYALIRRPTPASELLLPVQLVAAQDT